MFRIDHGKLIFRMKIKCGRRMGESGEDGRKEIDRLALSLFPGGILE